MKPNREQHNKILVESDDFMLWKGTHNFMTVFVCECTCALEKLYRNYNERNKQYFQFRSFDIYLE